MTLALLSARKPFKLASLASAPAANVANLVLQRDVTGDSPGIRRSGFKLFN